MNKTTHIFGWDEEPAAERPSEFIPSTSFSAESGYQSLPEAPSRPRRSTLRPPVANRYAGLQAFVLFSLGLVIVAGGMLMLFAALRHA